MKKVKLTKEYDKKNGTQPLPKDHVMMVSNAFHKQIIKDGSAVDTNEPLKQPSVGMREAVGKVSALNQETTKNDKK